MRALVLAAVASTLLCACSPAPQCATRPLAVSEVCSDGGSFAANQPLTVQVREQCGSACGMNTMFACSATVDGGSIVIAPTISECTNPDTACPAVCRISAVDCSVPALAAGTYSLSVAGLTTQQLVVSADGGSSRCAF